jgi:hypothetical protein
MGGFGGLGGLGSMFNNPQMAQMATQMMSDPNVQNMMSQMMGAFSGGAQDPNAPGGAAPGGLDNLMRVGEQVSLGLMNNVNLSRLPKR